jgi:hypothetical protein
VANSNLAESLQATYIKIFPRNSSYIWWRDYFTPDYGHHVFFGRDSLAAVGGELSIDAFGAMKAIPNYDNRFKVSTDSIAGSSAIRTHRIKIDSDPSNAEFIAELGSDRIRAIAWQEAAGTLSYGIHQRTFSQYNHYWDDTTRVPCENGSGYDTGIMQIYRHPDWEPWFRRSGNPPAGYIVTRWDSLAWNWKVCIANGKYICNTYMPYMFKAQQRLFPDSCSLADCDTFPTHKNKEDLKTFGYHRGDPFMKKIVDDDTWKQYIAVKTDPPEWADYVQKVRKYYYRKSWQ